MERYYWAALQTVPGLGNSRLKNLIAFFGSARRAWQANRRDLFFCRCLDDAVCNNLVAQREKIDIPKIAGDWEKKKIKVCTMTDEEYPARLKNTFDPPVVLYYQGRLPAEETLIGVVGARKATAYGKSAAMLLASGLAAAGVGVVSGAARGIDTAAHHGALDQAGYTIAVLGCGVDVCYPPENGKLLASIAERGAVISEYAPGTSPLAKFFPLRNRIISGLSRGVVVVEAAEKSGSLITADFALEDGRDVFAVPGSIFADGSKGTHRLIRQGAKPVFSAEDILEEYGLETAKAPKKQSISLSTEEFAVYRRLTYDVPLGMEEINMQTDIQPQALTYILLQLELKGLIVKHSGQRYVRIPGRESDE